MYCTLYKGESNQVEDFQNYLRIAPKNLGCYVQKQQSFMAASNRGTYARQHHSKLDASNFLDLFWQMLLLMSSVDFLHHLLFMNVLSLSAPWNSDSTCSSIFEKATWCEIWI